MKTKELTEEQRRAIIAKFGDTALTVYELIGKEIEGMGMGETQTTEEIKSVCDKTAEYMHI